MRSGAAVRVAGDSTKIVPGVGLGVGVRGEALLAGLEVRAYGYAPASNTVPVVPRCSEMRVFVMQN